ncbi:MAG: DUF1501 domain-containing protein [Phycisphaerales bacterium]|jgi:uncharacterized protein (DUF1501 family)|nr:DUF1501 domain-containing protein [Phycisphaerales bacterium]
MTDHHAWTRRHFLRRGTALASLATTAPLFIEQASRAMSLPAHSMLTSLAGVPQDHVLVVVQLGGGNDGLNTVVPYGADEYYKRRPQLAIAAPGRGGDAALELPGVDGLGLHPAFSGMRELLDRGVASVVQGIGYPNPNRSHFSSMDIWHTADTNGRDNGWIGRYFDNACTGTPEAASGIALGNTAPLAMQGDRSLPVSFESADLYRWVGEDFGEDVDTTYRAMPVQQQQPDGNNLAFLKRTTLDAQLSSDQVRQAASLTPLVEWPRSDLANQLRMVAAMIRSDMPTRVYYVSLGGFDTHANQAGAHQRLLRQVGDSLLAFNNELREQGNDSRVLTMVFSEFGRRVGENASGGTDHGTAAPMYLVGPMVQPGVLGTHPSLTNLDNGDLKFTADFRQVYAAVLEGWMGADPDVILRRRWSRAPVLKT